MIMKFLNEHLEEMTKAECLLTGLVVGAIAVLLLQLL
jgi:hypothetical protein